MLPSLEQKKSLYKEGLPVGKGKIYTATIWKRYKNNRQLNSISWQEFDSKMKLKQVVATFLEELRIFKLQEREGVERKERKTFFDSNSEFEVLRRLLPQAEIEFFGEIENSKVNAGFVITFWVFCQVKHRLHVAQEEALKIDNLYTRYKKMSKNPEDFESGVLNLLSNTELVVKILYLHLEGGSKIAVYGTDYSEETTAEGFLELCKKNNRMFFYLYWPLLRGVTLEGDIDRAKRYASRDSFAQLTGLQPEKPIGVSANSHRAGRIKTSSISRQVVKPDKPKRKNVDRSLSLAHTETALAIPSGYNRLTNLVKANFSVSKHSKAMREYRQWLAQKGKKVYTMKFGRLSKSVDLACVEEFETFLYASKTLFEDNSARKTKKKVLDFRPSLLPEGFTPLQDLLSTHFNSKAIVQARKEFEQFSLTEEKRVQKWRFSVGGKKVVIVANHYFEEFLKKTSARAKAEPVPTWKSILRNGKMLADIRPEEMTDSEDALETMLYENFLKSRVKKLGLRTHFTTWLAQNNALGLLRVLKSPQYKGVLEVLPKQLFLRYVEEIEEGRHGIEMIEALKRGVS